MYEIKPLEKQDIKFIFGLMSELSNISALHTDIIPLQEWQRVFSKFDNDEENFIVYSNDTPCGWLKINGLQNKDTAWISMIVVSDSFKRKGVGKFAVEFAIDYFKQHEFNSVNIQTTKDNLPAISLYEKCGLKMINANEGKITFSRCLTDLSFTKITNENINNYKSLRKIFAKYKMQTLRNHGEKPGNKKMFYNLFDSIIPNASDSNSEFFIVIQKEKELIGFASISTSSTDVVDIPYSYGTVKDFYISPKHRRKGYGKILNDYIENIFKSNKTNTVLLSPDPVSGIDFWKAMGYRDTGIHQGWGRHLVYIKHLIKSQNSAEIDNAISKLVTPTDYIGINPYNKPQIKEVYGVWKEYRKNANQKPHKKDIKNMAWNARKNRNVSFKVLYYKSKIVGFVYNENNYEIKYILPQCDILR